MARRTIPGSHEVGQDPRWIAVARRDRDADGRFVYAVRSTGVYCRPSCPSRRPRIENVLFFGDAPAAEQAGFRACRRCRPERPGPADAPQVALVAALCREIEAAGTPPTLAALAAKAGMSPFHLHRVFTKVTGLSPRAYADAGRMAKVQDRLAQGSQVTAAIQDAGWESSARFYARAEQMLGMAPRHFRGGGAGVSIVHAVSRCALGAILVAATVKGVCAVFLGDEPDTLLGDLRRRFPGAELRQADEDFARTVARVVAVVDAPQLECQLPLDIRGTAFQQRVWKALREIPPGATASYSEIAARLDCPRSARAVAQACAANPLAVVIPCHRVVRQDGALSGYRWGIERKRRLLEREGSAGSRAGAPAPAPAAASASASAPDPASASASAPDPASASASAPATELPGRSVPADRDR